MLDVIDFFYQHAGAVLRPYMTVELARPTDTCAVCLRSADRWLVPTQKVCFNNYGTVEDHCLSCHSLYEGSTELFGVERLAGKTPVPMKLGMATGCGALITPRETTLFLNGFIKKLGAAARPPFAMKELSGQKAHRAIIQSPPSDEQFLYIGNFGRKKPELVASLELSDPERLVICEANGSLRVSISAAQALINADQETGITTSRKNEIKSVLRRYYTGLLKPKEDTLLDALRQISVKEPAIWKALKNMPADPHDRLNLLQLW